MKRKTPISLTFLFASLLLAIVLSQSVTIGADRIMQTSVKLKTPKKAPRGDERLDAVKVSIWIPEGVKVLRGIIVNPFYINLVEREDYHEAARLWEFGLIGANFFGVKNDDYDTLLVAMKDFAEKSGHREIEHLPILFNGFSAGSGMLMKMANMWPERVIACGPVGLEVGPETPETRKIPVLTIFGEKDMHQMEILTRKLPEQRKEGALWGIAVNWGLRHDYANANDLVWPFFDQVIRYRLPKDQMALNGPVKLLDYREEDGWLGDISTWDSSFATINSYKDYKGDRTKAAWFPNEYVARTWQGFVSRRPTLAIQEPVSKPEEKTTLFAKTQFPIITSSSIPLKAKRVDYFDGCHPLTRKIIAANKVVVRGVEPGVRALIAVSAVGDKNIISKPVAVIVKEAPKRPSPLEGKVSIVLEGALFQDRIVDGKPYKGPPVPLYLETVNEDGEWHRVIGNAPSFNSGHHRGRVLNSQMSPQRVDLAIEMNINSDPWVPGGRAVYEIVLKLVGENQFEGVFTGMFRGKRVTGKSSAERVEADAVPIAIDKSAFPDEQVLSMLRAEEDAQQLLSNMRKLQVPEALSGLASILRDLEKPEYIRKRAAFVMGKIGSREARKVVVEVLERTEAPKLNAWESLWGGLTQAVYDCIEKESEQELLEDLQHQNPCVRWSAAMQLGKRKSVVAVDALIELLKDPHPKPRLGATWALGEIQDAKGIEELIAIVEKRRVGGSRVSAIEAMGKILTPRCIEAIKSVEPNDPDYWMVAKSPFTRVEELKADLSSFNLILEWHKPIIEKMLAYPSLVLTVPKYEGESDWIVVRISEEQATKIIDYLLVDGYVRLATDMRGKDYPQGYPARYSLRISTKGGPDLSETYDLNLEFIKRLCSLREVLYGEAAEAMDGLLEQIQPQCVVDESNALGMWGDETDENRELWLLAKASLPQSNFLGVGAAWLDKEHTTAVCILFKTSPGRVELYEYTNAYAAVVDKTVEGFTCRQFIKLWDSEEDYNRKERLSLPMHHRFLSQNWRGWPKYSHANVTAVDMDGDLDKDLVVNLWYSGGSYSGAETSVLQNNGGIYTIILSKKGAESQRFDTEAKRISRITDLDGDGIVELLIWDEIWGPRSHAESRCWLDIYHWDGSKMAKYNSSFRQAYEQPKKGFLKICKLYPDQTPEYYYYLGMISEYQGQIDRAIGYYDKCLKCTKSPRKYIDAANERLRRSLE